jgi:hypothetical protein
VLAVFFLKSLIHNLHAPRLRASVPTIH